MLNNRVNIDKFNYTFKVYSEEEIKQVRFNVMKIIIVKNKGHARAIRKRTKCNEVITGDIFYSESWWLEAEEFKFLPPTKTGMAIQRNNEIIWYSIPGIPKGTAKRTILFEKSPRTRLKIKIKHTQLSNKYDI